MPPAFLEIISRTILSFFPFFVPRFLSIIKMMVHPHFLLYFVAFSLWQFHAMLPMPPASDGPVKCGIAPLNKNFTRFDYLMPDTHRLVGGLETSPHAWPWTGQLVTVKEEDAGGRGNFTIVHKCGCALIDHNFVVTAAHCFAKSRIPSRYRILLGGHEIYSGHLHRVLGISIHPLYQIVQSAYDVALLRISPSVEYDDNTWPVCLPTVPAKINGMCVVTGWGRLKEGGERARMLREIHVPIIAPVTCNDFRHYAGRMHPPSMICAGFNGGRVDSCQGDSGGPLQCQNANGQWEVQGVVSWGIGCAQSKFPGIYTKMFIMVPWIRAEMNRLKAMEQLAAAKIKGF